MSKPTFPWWKLISRRLVQATLKRPGKPKKLPRITIAPIDLSMGGFEQLFDAKSEITRCHAK
jgi:hypothetical protein